MPGTGDSKDRMLSWELASTQKGTLASARVAVVLDLTYEHVYTCIEVYGRTKFRHA